MSGGPEPSCRHLIVIIYYKYTCTLLLNLYYYEDMLLQVVLEKHPNRTLVAGRDGEVNLNRLDVLILAFFWIPGDSRYQLGMQPVLQHPPSLTLPLGSPHLCLMQQSISTTQIS